MKIALIALAGLAAAFVFTPVIEEPASAGKWVDLDDYAQGKVSLPPSKSGLQYAVEGRLRWLGVL
jgi:hypothetical protein